MKKIVAILFFIFIALPIGAIVYLAAEVFFFFLPVDFDDHEPDDSDIRQCNYLINP